MPQDLQICRRRCYAKCVADPSNQEAIQAIRTGVKARLDEGGLASAAQPLHAALARTPPNAAPVLDLAEFHAAVAARAPA